jgi:hypothetical protein
MSPLPQRKKTAEEIAKLRESLGIPDAAPPPLGTAGAALPPPPPPAITEPVPAEPPTAPADRPAPAAPPAPAIPEPLPEPVHRSGEVGEAIVVRSLKKSERLPLPRPPEQSLQPGTESKIPTGRRSEKELNELRRQQAFEAKSPVVQLQAITAHPFLLGIGYVLALAGGVGGLAVAAYLWRKKPRSMHHAGFIATIAFFVIFFGALYLFPQLRNDT